LWYWEGEVHWHGKQIPHRRDDLGLTFQQTCSGFGRTLLTEESRTQRRDDSANNEAVLATDNIGFTDRNVS
jgi:hypothetical protein